VEGKIPFIFPGTSKGLSYFLGPPSGTSRTYKYVGDLRPVRKRQCSEKRGLALIRKGFWIRDSRILWGEKRQGGRLS